MDLQSEVNSLCPGTIKSTLLLKSLVFELEKNGLISIEAKNLSG
jgi:hypothetical protein